MTFLLRYNESCLHGVITASKMLFLSESVRDVIDIKLSKRFNPPVNILGILSVTEIRISANLLIADTPCTASSHMRTRVPEIAKIWMKERRGCFERPTLDRPPHKVSLPKLKASTIVCDLKTSASELGSCVG